MTSGAGLDITPQETHRLLNKWMTEAIKMQGLLVSANGFKASVLGTLIPSPGGGVSVVLDRNPPLTTYFEFKPGNASHFKYGDVSAFPPGLAQDVPGASSLASTLLFIFPDQSMVALFEVTGWK